MTIRSPIARGLLPLLAVLSLGCGSWGRAGNPPAPSQTEALTQILDLASVYQRMGRLAAGGALPFVANVAFLAGPGDSTLAVIGISLENRHLGFQRSANDFAAHYRVELSAAPQGGGRPTVFGEEQSVRVGSFAETQRNDESILYQRALTLPPGGYRIAVQVADRTVTRQSRAEADMVVPVFGAGDLSAPVLVYQARFRTQRDQPVSAILNPRGTLAYGGDSAVVYVEGYHLAGPMVVPLALINQEDSVVRVDSLHFAGGEGVETQVLRFTPDSAPLGELRLVLGEGSSARSTAALVSFSPNWVVTNFDDMLSLLRYYPSSPALDSLRKAPPSERGRLWREFSRASDPDPATPAHEGLDRYFRMVALANARFRDEGGPGWRTDRGEVLIRLGEPDEVLDASPASEGRLIRWGYTQLQLTLYFVDETGFGRFRLSSGSRAELERVLSRLSRQSP
jgi:GWxTD domain-containing protein